MPTRWILVSDASRARLFALSSPRGELHLVESYEHPDSRAHVRDLMADANGRKPAGPSVGSSYGGRSVSLGFGRPGTAQETDPKEVEAQKFARELAEQLERGLQSHAYEKLVLAAPPHFLGLLKAAVSHQVTKHVEVCLNKDLTKLDVRELTTHVHAEIGPPRA